MVKSKISWEIGSAYDFFASLDVLHNPGSYGLRASWAAGVRSRLSSDERDDLDKFMMTIGLPLNWIRTLPEPKDSRTILWTLRQMTPKERLIKLSSNAEGELKYKDILERVNERGSWDEEDRNDLESLFHQKKAHKKNDECIVGLLDIWADADNYGERLLTAFNAYYDVFFAEEEKRIVPALSAAVDGAKKLASKLSFTDLVEELSQGIRFENELDDVNWLFTPSYWISPLVMFSKISSDQSMLLFGARPSDVSLVPGEVVPEGLLRVLKAMADPTRLRILRYLAHENISPAEITRRLRLRAPTVTHHLKILRLAGLVVVTYGEKKENKKYATRIEAIINMHDQIKWFLGEELDEI